MRNHNVRRANCCVGFLLLSFAALAANAKPNFTGEWKMNTAKSEFGPMPAPESRVDKIKHADPDLTVSTVASGQQGEMKFDLKYSTDGKETTNEMRGSATKSTAAWEGDALVITTKASFQGNDITLTDKWTLSDDGKALTIARHIKAPQGEFDQKMLMEKQ